MDHKEIYKKLLDKYYDKQVIVAIEELSELAKELCKALRGNDNKENIIEEMADVYIMLDQMQLFFGIDEKAINQVKAEKLERTKERLLIKC